MHLLVFFFFLQLLPLAISVHFNIPRFGPELSNLLYHGDAKPSSGGIVELISNYDYTCRVGWAIYAERIMLWDSTTGKLSDFTSHFSFNIDTRGLSRYGHGLAFFLGPVGFEIPPNSAGGFMGLFNTSTMDSPQSQIVMVEFDSFPNPEWDPKPLVEHVGINNNSLISAVHTPWNASFHSGDTADVWVTYNANTKNLSVFWTYKRTSNAQENTGLFYIIDLKEVLPEWVNIGFSAATGQFGERHQLQSWEFNSSLNFQGENRQSSKRTRIIVGVAVSVCVLAGGAIAGILISFKRRTKKQMMVRRGHTRNLTSINEDIERKAGPRRFSYEYLASAINNFSDERTLGKGGFAIAVKKISRGSRQGKKEYITEVKTIGQLRHRNLGEFLLVYEFMPNGSLDAHLFGEKRSLTWAVRYKISLGLASALLYLHEEWEHVVHRDVKSSNVMLDSHFNAKLGDFGLARLTDTLPAKLSMASSSSM
uniref:Protein kinase domain-containing protein n=1 Tax=Manihot esculenta TaxID=3983 RepID=A0A2C9UXE1_MANES